MEIPVANGVPMWAPDDEASQGTIVEPPLLGPEVPAWHQDLSAPTVPAPGASYTLPDQVLPFAPAPDYPMSSMQPAVVGATFPAERVASQLGQEQPPAPSVGSHVLGVVTLAVGVGAAAGLYYGGPFGGVAGSLLGGCAANVYRAVTSYRSGTPEGDAEAKVSATYAVIAAALGGWVAYKFAKPRPGLFESNPEQAPGLIGVGAPPPGAAEDSSRTDGPASCRPRHAYPVVSKACEERS